MFLCFFFKAYTRQNCKRTKYFFLVIALLRASKKRITLQNKPNVLYLWFCGRQNNKNTRPFLFVGFQVFGNSTTNKSKASLFSRTIPLGGVPELHTDVSRKAGPRSSTPARWFRNVPHRACAVEALATPRRCGWASLGRWSEAATG